MMNINLMEQYADVSGLIDLMLLGVYSAAGDWPQFYYGNLNKPPGPLRFVSWDLEDAFGGGSVRTQNDPATDRLNQVEDFVNLWKANADFRLRFGLFMNDNFHFSFFRLEDYIMYLSISIHKIQPWNKKKNNNEKK